MLIKKFVLNYFLQKKNHKPIEINKIKKILFIRNARIGDAVCSFPLLRELSINFPEVEIDVYAGYHSNFLFEKLPYCKNIFTKFRKKHFYKTFFQLIKMRLKKYDLIIEAMPMKFGLEFSVWFINSKWIISFGKDSGDQKIGLYREDLTFYDYLKQYNCNEHMVEHLSGFLPYLGINNYSIKMEFPYDEEKFIKAKEFVLKLNTKNPIITINVDSSSPSRNLYKKQIIQIANALKNYTIIILSLPSRQKEMMDIIKKENLLNCVLSYETKTIFDVAEIIRVSNLLISPDTSLIHIASAIDIPTIGIYRNDLEHINLWAPRSRINYVVKSSNKDFNSIEGFDINEIVNHVNVVLCNK